MFHSIHLTYSRLIIFKNRFFINGKWGAFPVHSAGKRSYRPSKIDCFHTFTAPQTPTVQRIAVKDTSFTLLSHIRRETSAKPIGQMLSGFLLILWKQIAGGLQAGFLAGATPLPAWAKGVKDAWRLYLSQQSTGQQRCMTPWRREGSLGHSLLCGEGKGGSMVSPNLHLRKLNLHLRRLNLHLSEGTLWRCGSVFNIN